MKVATTILQNDNKILLIKKFTNRYSMPGGKVEIDEVPIKTATREFYEETGLTIKNIALNSISTIVKDNQELELYTFYATSYEGDLLLKTREGHLEWIEIANLANIEMYAGDLEIIKHCLSSYEINLK